jgi:hypothetical protein
MAKVRDKNGTVMFEARPSQSHRGLYTMRKRFPRDMRGNILNARMVTYFSDFEDDAGTRQSDAMM